MVKADLDMTKSKTFVHDNYGLVGSIMGDDENEGSVVGVGEKEGTLKFLEFFEGEGQQTFSNMLREQKNTSITLNDCFGPGGLAGFVQQIMQQVSVALMGARGASPMCVDNDPEYLANKKREEELAIEVEREETKERIREQERRLAELRAPDLTATVTGQKRPAITTAVKVPVKKERLERSTAESDAGKLEILREMHALYVVEVEKECILPDLKVLSKKQKRRHVDEDPKKELKGRLRRGKPSIRYVPEVGGFLRDVNPALWGKFDEAFGGKGHLGCVIIVTRQLLDLLL